MSVSIIKDWELKGYYPNLPIYGFSEKVGVTQSAVTPTLKVNVPCDIYTELYKIGIIDNPIVDDNVFKCEWVSKRWWVYTTTFFVNGSNPRLVFNGVDGKFRVYVNNKYVISHNNSFTPVSIDLKKFNGQSVSVTVIVESLCENINQVSYTSKITTQRPRFSAKWDFCPSMLSVGIQKSVELRYDEELTDIFVKSDIDGNVNVSFKRKYKSLKNNISLELNGKKYYAKKEQNSIDVKIDNPKLWSCNGVGKPNLYKGVLRVERNGEAVWEKSLNIGFRSVEFVRNENSSNKSLPYTLVLNGEKVYIKGVNFVPLEMSQSLVDKTKYLKLLKKVKECNANLIRVWGGGVIESEDFYSLCDKLGIMVWQDFTQSSSAIDNQATVKPEGLKKLKETAIFAVKRIRNHPSHVVYCGGNELMDYNFRPHGFDNKNIALLKSVVDEYDFGKYMLPTTASGHNSGPSIASVGKDENDDIHGPWTLFDFEEYCDVYNKLDSKFHSEFGVDGYCNLSAHNKMFSPKRRKYKMMQDDFYRLIKGEWWNCEKRDEFLFGEINNLEERICLSQFIQAEGIRYAIEANRRRAYQNSGSIVWQFNEPFPNLICTNIVDYYGQPKLAYYAVKKAFAPINLNFKYDKFYAEHGKDFLIEIFLTSDSCGKFDCTVEIFGDNKKISEYNYSCTINEKGKSVLLKKLIVKVEDFSVIKLTSNVRYLKEEIKNKTIIPVMKDGKCDKQPIIDYFYEVKVK